MRVWILFVNNLRNIIGIGIIKGIKEIRIIMINLLVNIFLKSWKLSDRGFVKFFKMLMGKRIGVGWMYLLKYFNFFLLSFV